MTYFSNEQILQLSEKAVSVGLATKENREALLSGIPNEVKASLGAFNQGTTQIVTDLAALNKVECWIEGSTHLRIWLRNATFLSAGRVEASFFQKALNSFPEGVERRKKLQIREKANTLITLEQAAFALYYSLAM